MAWKWKQKMASKKVWKKRNKTTWMKKLLQVLGMPFTGPTNGWNRREAIGKSRKNMHHVCTSSKPATAARMLAVNGHIMNYFMKNHTVA